MRTRGRWRIAMTGSGVVGECGDENAGKFRREV